MLVYIIKSFRKKLHHIIVFNPLVFYMKKIYSLSNNSNNNNKLITKRKRSQITLTVARTRNNGFSRGCACSRACRRFRARPAPSHNRLVAAPDQSTIHKFLPPAHRPRLRAQHCTALISYRHLRSRPARYKSAPLSDFRRSERMLISIFARSESTTLFRYFGRAKIVSVR